ADWIASHTQIVFHTNLCSILYLAIRASERGNQSTGGHRASYSDFALAANFGARDGSVFLVQDADGSGGKQIAKDALGGGARGKQQVIARDSRNDSGCSVCRRGDDASAGSIFLIYGHREGIDPIHGRQRIRIDSSAQLLKQTRRAAANF